MLILTRFLYSKDEVELSLIMALLKNEELQIIYYWAYELYYSGFDVMDLLVKIYLDFYYEKQPYLLAYIKKKQKLLKADGDMKHIAYVLRNMHKLTSTNSVFMARQYMFNYKGELLDYGADSVCATNNNDSMEVCADSVCADSVCADCVCADDIFGPTIIYKFKHVTISDEDPKKPYQNLLIALSRGHMENVWYYLKDLLEKKVDVSAIGEVVGEFLPNYSNEMHPDMLDNIQNIIAYIVRDMNDDAIANNDANKHIFVAPRQEHLLHLLALEEQRIPVVYNTLLHKRMATIDESIGAFKLARWQWTEHTDFVKDMWFHWEYYAMGSPLWLKRLVVAGGSINQQMKKIEFATEEAKEAFYQLYAYELDELPQEVQAMSLKPLIKHTFWENV